MGEPLGKKNVLKLSLVAKGTTRSPTFKRRTPDYVSFTIPSLSKATKEDSVPASRPRRSLKKIVGVVVSTWNCHHLIKSR